LRQSNAFDCLNLVALAASQAGSDDPAEIAPLIAGISDGGTPCRDYAGCMALMTNGRNVDYDGPGGDVELGSAGDPVSYPFERWTYDDQGVDVPITAAPAPAVPAS